jgi:uncharacterized membrane protein YedE/YeeE
MNDIVPKLRARMEKSAVVSAYALLPLTMSFFLFRAGSQNNPEVNLVFGLLFGSLMGWNLSLASACLFIRKIAPETPCAH